MSRFSLRQLVLALVFAGTLGLGTDLLLLEHTETWTQWIPLVALAVGLVSTIAVATSPGRASVAAFRIVMAAFVVAGVVGVYLHYAGNAEFAMERDSALSGFKLFWKSVRGATPALAPAALAQLGLLGLAYALPERGGLQSATRPEAVE